MPLSQAQAAAQQMSQVSAHVVEVRQVSADRFLPVVQGFTHAGGVLVDAFRQGVRVAA